jgi:hypothetical protein
MTWGRDTGQVIATPNQNIEPTMAHLNGPNGHLDFIQDPVPYVVNGKDTSAIRLGVPIINKTTNETVGMVACIFNIAAM